MVGAIAAGIVTGDWRAGSLLRGLVPGAIIGFLLAVLFRTHGQSTNDNQFNKRTRPNIWELAAFFIALLTFPAMFHLVQVYLVGLLTAMICVSLGNRERNRMSLGE